jgi:hypothetical protein
MRVGKRVIEVCTIVEKIGSSTGGVVFAWMDGSSRENAAKYCSRAVGLGLMTVDRSVRPMQFDVIEGWRERAQPIQRIQPYLVRPRIEAPTRSRFALHSVWGAQA